MNITEQSLKRIPHWVFIIAACLLFLCAAIFYIFNSNTFSLVMRLTGDSDVYLEYGSAYEEQGVSVTIYGSKILRHGFSPKVPVRISGEVDENHLGKYSVQYETEYWGCKANAERTVWIVDTQNPVIELYRDREQTIAPGEKYIEDGFIAYDNYNGDISHLVVRREEEGRIIYSVVDSSGNPCYVQRILPGYDPIAPIIKLNDAEHLILPLGVRYADPGFSAWDDVDGNLTESVTVEGAVDWLNPGKYPITYSVTDAFGNHTQTVRLVEVPKAPRIAPVFPENKTIYLTFDDGPGEYTLQLLDILDKHNVKATFFVVNSDIPEVMKEITQRGHSIGVHTISHNYEEIYASKEAYFDDLIGMQDLIFQITGVKTYLMRFPGGSSNTISSKTPGLMTDLSEAVQDAGFRYFDWNVDSNDAGGARTSQKVFYNSIAGIQQQDISVVLLHDIHKYSVDAVEDLILWGINNGYRFLPLSNDSPCFHHDVAN